MDDLSLQQYYRLQIEEKHRIDEYSVFLEDTVRNVRYLNCLLYTSPSPRDA